MNEKETQLEELEETEEVDTLTDKVKALQLPSQYVVNVTRQHKLTDDVAAKLEYAFKNGHTKKSACNYAGITTMTYDKWTKKYPMFETHMDMAQEYLKDKALRTVAYYLENKDPDVAKWYLERKFAKEYSKNPDVAMQINNYTVDFISDDEPSN